MRAAANRNVAKTGVELTRHRLRHADPVDQWITNPRALQAGGDGAPLIGAIGLQLHPPSCHRRTKRTLSGDPFAVCAEDRSPMMGDVHQRPSCRHGELTMTTIENRGADVVGIVLRSVQNSVWTIGVSP
jgi:hypothetical protein